MHGAIKANRMPWQHDRSASATIKDDASLFTFCRLDGLATSANVTGDDLIAYDCSTEWCVGALLSSETFGTYFVIKLTLRSRAGIVRVSLSDGSVSPAINYIVLCC